MCSDMKRSTRHIIKKHKQVVEQYAHAYQGLEMQERGGWEKGLRRSLKSGVGQPVGSFPLAVWFSCCCFPGKVSYVSLVH